MLNYIWAAMIVIGILYGAFTGNIEAVSNAALDSAGEAVDLCLTMAGVTALWVGLMEIAKNAGLIASMTRGISPFVSFLFPKIPKNHPAREYISTNIIANLLGLGWAATPAGLKAMEKLQELNEEECTKNRAVLAQGKCLETGQRPAAGRQAGAERRWTANWKNRAGFDPKVASNEMCTFLILNISSLQLIPVNMIAYRSRYGSAAPTAIVGPAIAATFVSTAAAVVYCKWMDRKR